QWGWQWAFIITGAIGLIWLIFWFWLYEVPAKQKRLSKAEFNYIHSDLDENETTPLTTPDITANIEPEKKISWFMLLKYNQTWAFVLGKFLTDPIWWFYLFWLPAFLQAEYGIEGTGMAMPVALVYTLATLGSVRSEEHTSELQSREN